MIIHFLEKSFGKVSSSRLQMAEFFPVYWNRENFKSFRKDLGLSAQYGPFSVELSAILIALPGDL